MPLPFHADDRPATLNRQESLAAFLNSKSVRPDTLTPHALASLSEAARQDYNRKRRVFISGGMTIMTPQVLSARRLLGDCFSENVGRNSGHSGLMLDGQSGAGKTTTCKTLMQTVWSDYFRQFPDALERGHFPVVYVEVPAGSTGKLLMREFASFFGLSVRASESMSSIRSRVVDVLNAARTQLIVVDELHNLAGRAAGLGESVDLLKNLHNDLGATFTYAGIDLKSGQLLAGPRGQQLLGRFTFLNMRSLRMSDPVDRATWTALIRSFETQLPLSEHEAGSLETHQDYLFKRTGGSIGSLGRLLTRAAIRTIENPELPEIINLPLMDEIVLDKAAEDFYEKSRRPPKPKPKPKLKIVEDFS